MKNGYQGICRQGGGPGFPGSGLREGKGRVGFFGGSRSTVSQLLFDNTFPLPRVSRGAGNGTRWYVPAPALAEEYAKRIEESGWVPEEVRAEVGGGTEGKARGKPGPGRPRNVCGEEVVGHGD